MAQADILVRIVQFAIGQGPDCAETFDKLYEMRNHRWRQALIDYLTFPRSRWKAILDVRRNIDLRRFQAVMRLLLDDKQASDDQKQARTSRAQRFLHNKRDFRWGNVFIVVKKNKDIVLNGPDHGRQQRVLATRVLSTWAIKDRANPSTLALITMNAVPALQFLEKFLMPTDLLQFALALQTRILQAQGRVQPAT